MMIILFGMNLGTLHEARKISKRENVSSDLGTETIFHI